MPRTRQPGYWRLSAAPGTYDVKRAVRTLTTDTWTVGSHAVHAGDRAIIWKAKGRDTHRGVVAFATY